MAKNGKQLTYGLIILVPLVVSMLFMGINNYSKATQDKGPDLNQSEVAVISQSQIWLRLVIDGNDIEGESVSISMDREGKIEIWSFRHEISTLRDESSGALTGRRIHSRIIITKRIDKTSPLLIKALAMNEVVDSAEFRFYRPSTDGSGTEEHYYTILIENGYVASVKTLTLIDYSTHGVYNMEEISFVFQDITWTYEIGGATFKDSWRGET